MGEIENTESYVMLCRQPPSLNTIFKTCISTCEHSVCWFRLAVVSCLSPMCWDSLKMSDCPGAWARCWRCPPAPASSTARSPWLGGPSRRGPWSAWRRGCRTLSLTLTSSPWVSSWQTTGESSVLLWTVHCPAAPMLVSTGLYSTVQYSTVQYMLVSTGQAPSGQCSAGQGLS